MSTEQWVDIIGYEGYYQVSNLGRARSLDRKVKHRKDNAFIKGAILNQHPLKGYRIVRLSKDAVQRNVLIHRLVAIAFIPNPNNKPDVNHKDCNKHNNAVYNLEWSTERENIRHAVKMGRWPKSNPKPPQPMKPVVYDQFADLFTQNRDEQIDHDSAMLSFQFISEIQKKMDDLRINKADLAIRIGVSKAYLTQLWRGHNVINMSMLAKIQIALGIKFEITTNPTTNDTNK